MFHKDCQAVQFKAGNPRIESKMNFRILRFFSFYINRLKAEAKDLSQNKPSIKPEAAGRGFMRGLFRDKSEPRPLIYLNFLFLRLEHNFCFKLCLDFKIKEEETLLL